MIGEQLQKQVQQQAVPFPSRWVASCLPKTEDLLRLAPKVVEALNEVEPLANYQSVVDAAVACLAPELRSAMAAFYAGRGADLRGTWTGGALARLDVRLATFVQAAGRHDLETIKIAIEVVRGEAK